MAVSVPLAQLCSAIIDCPHSTPKWTDEGELVLRSQNIRNGRLDLSQRSFTDERHFAERTRRAFPSAGDLVITREAPMGEVCMIPSDIRCCLGQRMVLLRPKPDIADPRYLLYALQSESVQHEIGVNEGTGSTVSNLRMPLLEALPIPMRTLSEQRAIAHILGTLDDKIELNRRMNETLEEMARALFKSCFVDFGPVRAKAEGRDTGLPKHLADLFPDSFEDSELGEIPTGWRIGAFGDVAEHLRRGVRPNAINPSTAYIALEHMPRFSIALSCWGDSSGLESTKFEFKRGEILFGKLRPYFHKVGVAPVDGVCSTDIVVIAPKSDTWFGFVLGHASSTEFVDYTNSGSTGTKMPRTSWGEMARYAVVLPPESVALAFAGHVQVYVGRIVSAIHEGRTLAALRDALLPKLISGELRLNDVDRFIGRAM